MGPEPTCVADASGERALDPIVESARASSRRHGIEPGPPRSPTVRERIPRLAEVFRRAHHHFSTAPTLSYAGEWFLDNYHVIQETVQQVEEDMPDGYYVTLPRFVPLVEAAPAEAPDDIAGPADRNSDRRSLAHQPRIYAVVSEVIDLALSPLHMDRLETFLNAYQDTASLTMGELWAVPVMCRLWILQQLALSLASLSGVDIQATEISPAPSSESTPEDTLVANAIISLRSLATHSWVEFFESVSRVERILRDDPAGVYALMDFETRDKCRYAVEELARFSEYSEPEVARNAVSAARTGHPEFARTRHVGYYLIGDGRPVLDVRLGVRLPVASRLAGWAKAHPTVVYLGGVGLITGVFLAVALAYAATAGAAFWGMAVVLILTLVPGLTIAVDLVNWIITNALEPKLLPKLDFEDGIPDEHRTVVVIPSLLVSETDIDAVLRQLELNYLSNRERNVSFALLLSLSDANHRTLASDQTLITHARRSFEALVEKYRRPDGESAFYFLLRERVWNPNEGKWMGWERKRGKLRELNRLILGHGATTFDLRLGDVSRLRAVKYVITLDQDTILPRGHARRMVETMAHPLNEPQFDPETGRVIAGYTVLQPRVEVWPPSVSLSWFTRIFSSDTGLDLYTRAVSDTYQDLFAEGIFAGKGIYDVAAFERALDGVVPENSMLSHDLFEGIHGRAGLATDIVLFEDFPPNYLVYSRRQHRWMRGDWQLLPWLFRRVPSASGESRANMLEPIDRWKIMDNLRRSLLEASVMTLLVAAWLWLPGSAWVWAVFGLVALAVPVATGLLFALMNAPREGVFHGQLLTGGKAAARWVLAVALLPHQAWLSLHAIIITVYRVYVSRKHLLEWTTAAGTLRMFDHAKNASKVCQQMTLAALFSFALLLAVAWMRPDHLPAAAPLLTLWLFSPQIAYRISRPLTGRPTEQLGEAETRRLRRLARRTWLFFEQFVGPEDHWLPPDHFQEDPLGAVAHRTSPTNMGMTMLATVSAVDMGYICADEMALRLGYTIEAIDQLDTYRGHLLNWYDTRSLEPLLPRYVSTVDTGNFVASLIAVREGCLEQLRSPVWNWSRWAGLLDICGIIRELIREAGRGTEESEPVEASLERIEGRVTDARNRPGDWPSLLHDLRTVERRALDTALSEFVDRTAGKLATGQLRQIHDWSVRFRTHLAGMHWTEATLTPWLEHGRKAPETILSTDGWADQLSHLPAIGELDDFGASLLESLRQLENARMDAVAVEWIAGLKKDVEGAINQAAVLRGQLLSIAAWCERWCQQTDFSFLLDRRRKIFHIGYNVSEGRLDTNHYDLLASEARLASYIAVAKGDVSQSHWLHLSRPLTRVGDKLVLLSWSATMFEYLMPLLLMKAPENTLLGMSARGAVGHQIEYGQSRRVPWGASEAGYFHFDSAKNYQYRAFGVPGLGFKRGLGDELVVAPYASLLALTLRPRAVMKNLDHLLREEMLGHYGLYESVDYVTRRLPPGRTHAVVRSYYAHHQGMIFVSLDNSLNNEAMINRFHRDARVQSAELLLHEQVPARPPVEYPDMDEPAGRVETDRRVPIRPWQAPTRSQFPIAHYLSNGRYAVMITNSGAGYSLWRDAALTRWRPDSTRENWGQWIYLRDQESRDTWSAGVMPVIPSAHEEMSIEFHAHMVEFRRARAKIGSRLEICVSPDDDVEIRRLTLVNHDSVRRRILACSYNELALAPQTSDRAHPAYNKLFIESEFVEQHRALLAHRRRVSDNDETVWIAHACVLRTDSASAAGWSMDRADFLGRGGRIDGPSTLLRDGLDEGPHGPLCTLDPLFAAASEIELEPHAEASVSFVTSAARSRAEAILLIDEYQDWSNIRRAFERALDVTNQELRSLEVGTNDLERYQLLLSLLWHPHAGLRASREVLSRNQLGQPALWELGISGDHPILLIKVYRVEDLGLAAELLKAHNYWRRREIKIDVVILDMEEGYVQELHNDVRRLVSRTGSDPWVNQRGGIFIVPNHRLDDPRRALLDSAARVVLDARHGTLENQIRRIAPAAPVLPALVPGPAPLEPTCDAKPPARPDRLLFDNGIGGFDPDGKEYVIYLEPGVRPPLPWTNVVGWPEFGFLVTESGAGCTWAGNSGENRLTPWLNDPVLDPPGEALYMRDEETGRVWSPTPHPAGENVPFLVRHGAGYTVFRHHSHGLAQELRLFADPEQPVKIIELALTNTLDRGRRFTATYYAEWVLGTVRDVTQQFIVPEYDFDTACLLARNEYNQEFAGRVAFLTSDHPPHGVTTNRMEFLGRHGDLRFPMALGRVGLSGEIAPGVDPCAALQIHINLAANDTTTVRFVLGQGSSRDAALALAAEFKSPQRIAESWAQCRRRWDEILETVQVETPEPAMDLQLNRWLLLQALSCRIWGRTSLYQSSGAFGFRDQLQDALSLTHAAPHVARQHILRAAAHQFAEGDVLHWWHPPSGRGVRTRCSDDLLWLPYITAHYVDATGDAAILDEGIPFLHGPELEVGEEDHYATYEPGDERRSLYEHCLRALDRGLTKGPHGIPLIGGGDWNDGFNLVGTGGKGESVWLGWFIISTLRDFMPLAERAKDDERLRRFRSTIDELSAALDETAWDGEWYIRAFYDDGTPIGSKKSDECRIDALAQSWAAIAGAKGDSRRRRAMDAVLERLVREKEGLVLLFTPPFDKTPYNPGYIKAYPPGVRENGGQYTHAAVWNAWAFALLGRNETAVRLFEMLNPIHHADSPEAVKRYKVEPYVVAADIYGAWPHVGRGGWTWYTGSAAWMYRLGLEVILGIRRNGEKLRISPRIPASWQAFRVRYRYKTAVYSIRVNNETRRGETRITLDGSPVDGDLLPMNDDGHEHEVVVEL
jgi:cyclic beta-1,2-glucan synthetase